MLSFFPFSDPDDGVDDVDAKVENSATTIAQIFGKKDVIEIEYVIDPEGDFEITSEGKYREILVNGFKYPLEKDETSFIDLRSATLVSFWLLAACGGAALEANITLLYLVLMVFTEYMHF